MARFGGLPPRALLLISMLTAIAGCYRATNIGSDNPPPLVGVDGSVFTLPDGAVPVTFCGANACVGNQECCFATGACVTPGDVAACPLPDDANNNGCSANSQCAAGQFCAARTDSPSSCLGPGICQARTNCGSGITSSFCGCDGRTYTGVDACHAGVRTVSWNRWNSAGACGIPVFGSVPDRGDAGFDATADAGTSGSRTPCVIDSQCPSGQSCCAITNACFDPSHPEMCLLPPAGTDFPCDSNADCDSRWDMCVGGPACGAPGFCASPNVSSPCTGVLAPVCGCDGHTYTNECESLLNRVRVASDGGCADN